MNLIAEIRADWEKATGGHAVAAVRVNELDPDFRVTFVGPQAIAVSGLLNSLPRLLAMEEDEPKTTDETTADERSTLLTITVRKDGTAYVDGKGRHWETSGHQIILRTPAGGELEIAWPQDFNGSGVNAALADRLDEALAVKNPDAAVARVWDVIRELREGGK